MKGDSVLPFPISIVSPFLILSLVLVPASKLGARDVHLAYSIPPCCWSGAEVLVGCHSFSELMVNSIDQNVD